MEAMTTLPARRPFSRRDLDAMPDDGHRYEIVDGTLVVTPAPSLRHQIASSRLIQLLQQAAPGGFIVLHAPTDVVLDDATVLQPDLLVVRVEELTEGARLRPRLVVEILSPSSRRVDLTVKLSRYEAAGCPSYWAFDPEQQALTAWQLEAGRYVSRGQVAGSRSITLRAPFPVTVVPERLIS